MFWRQGTRLGDFGAFQGWIQASWATLPEMSAGRKVLRRNLLSGAALAGGSLLASGCLSPTLPLPPPSRPDITPPDSRGLSTLSGRVPSGTTALAQNLANGKLVGQVTDETGFYELQILAESGDRIALWYRDVYRDSSSTVILVPPAKDESGMGGAAGASSGD